MSKVLEPIPAHRVKFPGGAALELPGHMPVDQVQSTAKAVAPLLGGDGATIGPDPLDGQLRAASPTAQRFVENLWHAISQPPRDNSLEQIKPDSSEQFKTLMQAIHDNGITLAMMPTEKPTPITQAILDAKYPEWYTDGSPELAGKNFATKVDPATYNKLPRGRTFSSLMIDDKGHTIDLGDLVHKNGIEAATGDELPGDDSLGRALAEHKLVRINFGNREIAAEIHHPPSAQAIDALDQLFNANPTKTGSYDFYHGKANQFANGVKPGDLIDKIFEMFHSH